MKFAVGQNGILSYILIKACFIHAFFLPLFVIPISNLSENSKKMNASEVAPI